MIDKIKSFPGLVIGAVLAVGAGFVADEAWESFGWTTPEQHRADYEHVGHVESIARANAESSKRLEDRWDCYNIQARVNAILADEERTPLDMEAVRRLTAKMNAIGCDQYYE